MTGSLRLHAPTALEYFASLVADDASFAVAEAALSIAQDDYPALDCQSVLAEIDGLAARLKSRIASDAAPALQHEVEVAVPRVVVVVDVAREAELLEEEAVEQAQPLHRRGVAGDARLQPRSESVDLGEDALAVERGIVVLGDRERRLRHRQARVVGDERGEVLERGRGVQEQGAGHGKEV